MINNKGDFITRSMQANPFHPIAIRLPALYLGLLCCLLLSSCESTDTSGAAYARDEEGQREFFPEEVAYTRPGSLIEAIENPSPWVDSVFRTLSPKERIAQLIIIEAFSNKGPKYEADVMNLVKRYKVGGIIYFQGGPVRQAVLNNRLQAASKVPLLISMDAETGVGMRLDSTVQYPFQMMMGAIEDNGLIYRMGAEVAEEFKRLGMHVNFAPVADINNNPQNPIIGYRAFGEDKLDVTAKSLAYMRGMQENGIIAVAKHFPGHGDTDVDSHYDLPIIPHDRDRLDSLELYPFRELIKHGIGGIMVAHMHMPELDTTMNLPSTLSKPIVTNLLKKKLEFKGLVFTDAMVMKGVTKYFPPGEAEARALIAGNDVLERLNSVPKAIQAIEQAIALGYITQEEIDRRCKKMLAAKAWVGLDRYKPIELENLYEDLNPGIADSTNHALAEAAMTLLNNKKNFLPIRQKKRRRIATLSFGVVRPSIFQREINKYARIEANFALSRKANAKEVKQMKQKLKGYDLVLVGLYGPAVTPSNRLGYSKEAVGLVTDLARSDRSIMTLFDNPYTLNQFPDIHKSRVLILAYQAHMHAQVAAAKLLFGKIPARGKLPVTVNEHYQYGHGISKDKPLLAVSP
ncbi:glycoside hydrolase family 3 protein [Pontibacter sp. HSC-36F09]|uniref:glycoside hydrolase family 3 protein n=1 Tax=Pontibacter sp. HSC-36F09 TaxID=2910966 RepID=UPI0020A0DF00|nr:glycoside hydrolase family 3 N-terminal domain-containing protein [Pontibacter sp. HSC-36F09]MCP2044772.1 beta-glucosidase-like glycosyl hydrolase [Pontibacter sp. HSC-36F09]